MDLNDPSSLREKLLNLQQEIGANNLMLWIYEESDNTLVAKLSSSLPLERNFRQAIQRGIISQCFVTGIPLLESDVSHNPNYDPSYDLRSGQTVESLMAAPFEREDGLRGVLTAVHFTGSEKNGRFTPSSLVRLSSAARQISLELTHA